MKPVFHIRDLTFAYPGQAAPVIDHLDLTVEAGEFLVLCGPSGCGKSTLLRQLKTVLAPYGSRSGEILFEGEPLDQVDQRQQSRKIGFVLQSPENQVVTDKVWHELAFGLESLGYDTPTIRRRVAEMASFFGIQTWFYKDVSELSGGQKQLLSLAAVMAMQPSVLILDEPTSQLDPIAATDFLAVLGRINRELGTTVILTEHRLEDAFPLATRVAVLDRGRLLCTGAPAQVGAELKAMGHGMFLAMPAVMRIWSAVDHDAPCPVTVREGRDWLADYAAAHPLGDLPPAPERVYESQPAIQAEGVWFRYHRDSEDIVKGLSITVQRGEFLALLGGNGTGKTTSLKLLAGLLKPWRGKINVHGTIGVLPQNPQSLFVKATVREDLYELLRDRKLSQEEQERQVGRVAGLCRLTDLLDRHPFDLSGGEQQRAALAKVLLLEPEILLMDEPTKGLDAEFKEQFAQIIDQLLARKVTVLMVSHDVEFCARHAHHCALFFDGSIVTAGTPRYFFSGNSFYTTSANRMAREYLPKAATAEDVICACGGTPPQPPVPPEEDNSRVPPATPKKALKAPPATIKRGRAGTGTMVAVAMILLLVPLTLFLGTQYLGGRKHYFTALLVLVECMLPFFLLFEGRKPQARELVIIAVLCAIAVAGRAVFFMLPSFKPVLAMVIIAGVAFGGETGFLVGAVTMLVSNMLFSQGPWTPWQMFAAGLIGFLAGILTQARILGRDKFSLCMFGLVAAIVIYGGIMNPASALMAGPTVTKNLLLAYFLSGFPLDVVHALATFFFLFLAAEPMLEKLERAKIKYGLAETLV